MSVPLSSTWPWPQRRWVRVLMLFGLFTLIGLWQGNTTYLTMLGDGSQRCWGQPFVWELTGSWAAFLGSFLPIHATVSGLARRGSWWRFFAVHGAACALFAAVCPPLFLAMRHVLYPLLGWGPYHYGPLAWRLPMEWQKLVIAYIVIAGVTAFTLHLRESRQKTFREAELNARLQEARLQVLSAQLDPHFLFNALNTISSTMYENLDQTDRLLASLGQMLRNSLEGGSALWPLAQELKHLEAFLDFALARFGDRLAVRIDIEPSPSYGAEKGSEKGARNDIIPRFCLQRLVENSLKHNLDESGQSLSILIQVKRGDDGLTLAVQDNGKGFDPERARHGLGLANLKETLALCFGPSAQLILENASDGGARVAIHIPVQGRV